MLSAKTHNPGRRKLCANPRPRRGSLMVNCNNAPTTLAAANSVRIHGQGVGCKGELLDIVVEEEGG